MTQNTINKSVSEIDSGLTDSAFSFLLFFSFLSTLSSLLRLLFSTKNSVFWVQKPPEVQRASTSLCGFQHLEMRANVGHCQVSLRLQRRTAFPSTTSQQNTHHVDRPNRTSQKDERKWRRKKKLYFKKIRRSACTKHG